MKIRKRKMRPGNLSPQELASKRRRDRFEVQIHPMDIRSRVRYLFFSRRQVLSAAAAVLAYVLFLGFALWKAPSVIANLWSYNEYQQLVAERQALGEKLRPLVTELQGLAAETDDLRLTLDRIYLAYGLDNEASIGQGGYPFQVQSVPDSIYADLVRQGEGTRLRVTEQLRVLDIFTEEVKEFESARRGQILTTPSTCPLEHGSFVLTSPFGHRRNPFTNALDFHAGIDLSALEGTPIHAPADGVVVFAGRYPLRRSAAWWRYGNLVVLKNGDDFISLYAHCDEILVRKGQKVEQGDQLATVGNTGLSTNPHLHYEIRRRDTEGNLVPVDPRIYMLDLQLSDSEKLLVATRNAPKLEGFEPLPRLLQR
ncbi:MAG: M23 family metallopeptidase [Acidobacteriota bacterium]|nr:M23 family metallopeptidase [Acidobacteriota bacterium]